MTLYLRLEAPIQPAHRIGATRDDGDTVYLEIDAILGGCVLACGSDILLWDYQFRYEVVQSLPK
jgi:hypothetical protein